MPSLQIISEHADQICAILHKCNEEYDEIVPDDVRTPSPDVGRVSKAVLGAHLVSHYITTQVLRNDSPALSIHIFCWVHRIIRLSYKHGPPYLSDASEQPNKEQAAAMSICGYFMRKSDFGVEDEEDWVPPLPSNN
jgi:hypothetical protein